MYVCKYVRNFQEVLTYFLYFTSDNCVDKLFDVTSSGEHVCKKALGGLREYNIEPFCFQYNYYYICAVKLM